MSAPTLEKIEEAFSVSKAVFIGAKAEGGDIEFTVKTPYDPMSAKLDHTDPVVKRMVESYSENFNRYEGRYNLNSCKDRVWGIILRALSTAYINASPLKNPIQSKTYKWFVNDIDRHGDDRLREGLLELYRYVITHTTGEFRFYNGSDNPHAKNLVAIVEKLRDKYER